MYCLVSYVLSRVSCLVSYVLSRVSCLVSYALFYVLIMKSQIWKLKEWLKIQKTEYLESGT